MEDHTKVLESLDTKDIEAFLDKRRKTEATEKIYKEAISSLQQVHAFAADEFFEKVEAHHLAKEGKPLAREDFDQYAEVYKKSLEEVLEAIWTQSFQYENLIEARDFPMKDNERESRTREDFVRIGRSYKKV